MADAVVVPDTSDHSLITPPHGLGLALIIVSVVFPTLATISVVLRSYVLYLKGSSGWDDLAMVVGAICYLGLAGVTIYGALVGVGYKDADLEGHNWNLMVQGVKLYITWLMTYIGVLAIVKTSICITVYRIAVKRSHTIAVWVLLALNWISWLVLLVGILTYCHPWNTLWTPDLLYTGRGTCAAASQLVAIGQVATWTTVVGDLCLALLPGWILWSTQMKKKTKIELYGLLSFGSVACVFSATREPFLLQWLEEVDLLYVGGFIAILGVMEIGVGIMAASIPRFRRFFTISYWRNGESYSAGSRGGHATPDWQRKSLVTWGQGTGRLNRTRDGLEGDNYGVTLVNINAGSEHGKARENWERLPDNASDKDLLETDQSDGRYQGEGIYTQRSYSIQVKNQGGKNIG